MLEAEPQLDQELRVGGTQYRARRQRVRWISATAASYGVDTLFLALFAAIGTVPLQIPLYYGLAAAAICGFAYASFTRGWNLRYRDPNLTEPLILLAILMQLGVALAAPQVAFPFLANLFTVFAFGMLWLNLREAVAVWSIGVFGDAVLRAFSAAVHDTMRATDVFGRYGGEEFLLILVGTTTTAAFEAVERVRTAVASRDWRPIVPDAPVTMSAGVAGFQKGESMAQLLHRADQALYQAKHAGRNRTTVSEA